MTSWITINHDPEKRDALNLGYKKEEPDTNTPLHLFRIADETRQLLSCVTDMRLFVIVMLAGLLIGLIVQVIILVLIICKIRTLSTVAHAHGRQIENGEFIVKPPLKPKRSAVNGKKRQQNGQNNNGNNAMDHNNDFTMAATNNSEHQTSATISSSPKPAPRMPRRSLLASALKRRKSAHELTADVSQEEKQPLIAKQHSTTMPEIRMIDEQIIDDNLKSPLFEHYEPDSARETSAAGAATRGKQVAWDTAIHGEREHSYRPPLPRSSSNQQQQHQPQTSYYIDRRAQCNCGPFHHSHMQHHLTHQHQSYQGFCPQPNNNTHHHMQHLYAAPFYKGFHSSSNRSAFDPVTAQQSYQHQQDPRHLTVPANRGGLDPRASSSALLGPTTVPGGQTQQQQQQTQQQARSGSISRPHVLHLHPPEPMSRFSGVNYRHRHSSPNNGNRGAVANTRARRVVDNETALSRLKAYNKQRVHRDVCL